MGIVDQAVSISLVFTGFGLAAEVIEKKVPRLSKLTESAKKHPAYLGWFGIIGGILGLVVIPGALIGTSALGYAPNGAGIIMIVFYLIGSVVAVYSGRLILKSRQTEASLGESDDPDASKRHSVGLFAVFYGLSMFLLYSVVRFV